MRISRKMALYNARKKVLLYNAGVENADITGGLTAYAYVPSTSGSNLKAPTVTKNTSSLKLYVANASGGLGGSYFTTEKVNLTRARTMKIEVSDLVSSNNYVRMGASATKANKFTVAAGKTISETGTISLDVSSLSGDYYLFITLYGSGVKSITFTKWWLE
jgi:hypothetical protein